MKRISLLSIVLVFFCSAFAQTNHLVISQFYGGGGSASATYKNDYIEIFNPTTSTVSLSGWSVQYASNTGTSWNPVALTGSIAPGQYYLVAGATGAGINNLPLTPEVSSSLNMSNTAGKVALVNSTTALSGSCPADPAIIDMLGYGTTASCSETANGPVPTVTTALFRKNGGCLDANNNSTDFQGVTANPRNTSSTFNFCSSSACAPTNTPSTLNLTPSVTSIDGSFTGAAAGSVNASGYIVLVTTAAYLSELPVDHMIYNIGDDLGNAKVVAYGTGTSFTATGLSASTSYNFFVYGYSGTGCYNTAVQLKATASTTAPPACTPPSVQASAFNGTGFSSTQVDLSYTRGNGNQVLVVYHPSSAVDTDPVNGTAYTTGTQIGSGNFVGYVGPSNAISITGLQPNTQYYFAIYEYATATNCYTLPALTGTATTACGYASPVTAFTASTANAQVNLTWSLPASTGANGSCFDEVLIVASTSSITADGSTFTGSPNTVYSGSNQIVYRGTGTSVTITGLTNGTTYYFRAYSKLGASYTPVANAPQITAVPFNPLSGYVYLYGNLHAHSSYSDGNKADGTKTPKDDYEYARDAQCMDFLGISEHNHTGAGMSYPNYALGYNQANLVNLVPGGSSGNAIVTLWGMEWGVSSSGGGHVLIYGFDNQLIGWEAGQYDIFCAKNDYTSLWTLINNKPNSWASLAHPGGSDFGNLSGTAYNSSADNALFGSAVESGPALTDATDYNTLPSSLGFLGYYKSMLAKGYRMAPQIDQDNHYMTFGTINRNRTVVLATEKTRAGIMDALRNMRFYASEDCNAKLDYKSGTQPMGSSIVSSGQPSLTLSVTDPDAGESVSSIEIWGAQAGSGSNATLIKSYTSLSSISFTSSDPENVQPNNTTWYYFAIVTQGDGNKMVTAPIWYSRSDISLPVTLIDFTAEYKKANGNVVLSWSTAQEINSKEFIVERSTDDGRTWSVIGTVAAAGSSNGWRRYQLPDASPLKGTNLYRLKQIDLNNSFRYSAIERIRIGSKNDFFVYPNPSNGLVYINSSVNADNILVSVHDVNGKEVLNSTYHVTSGATVRMDLSSFTEGIYFIHITGKNSSAVQKLVIKK